MTYFENPGWYNTFNLVTSDILPSYSDKAILPQSVLSKIIDEIPEGQLPHPLIFKLTEIKDHVRSAYIGVKEFSSPDDSSILLPSSIKKTFGDEAVIELQRNIPKATSLKLKPKFVYNVQNWKFFLENKLTKFYTTLTSGETLIIEDENLRYELIVESINDSENLTACIIDTDIVLDVVPLNDHLASEQMLEFTSNPHNNIIEVDGEIEIKELKPFSHPKFVPIIYRIDLTKFTREISIRLQLSQTDNSDIIVGLDRFVSLENFRNTTMDLPENKRVTISLQDDDIVNKLYRVKEQQEAGDSFDEVDKWLYFIPFSWETTSSLRITVTEEKIETPKDGSIEIQPNQAKCSNCLNVFSKDKLVLHEAFCIRNNVKCPQCDSVFLKKIPDSHWHCQDCDFHTDHRLTQEKHIKLQHSQPYQCQKCDISELYSSFTELARHRSTECPAKLHECRFCHLVVPQEEYTYQDRFENLTHHENDCGNKTTECYKCGKIQRVKDYKKHMKIHELDKAIFNEDNKVSFRKCTNENCIQIPGGNENDLGLCELCYGPLYIAQLDPTHIKLQARLDRKYMIQLTKGCGNLWCENEYCATNEAIKGKPIKELMGLINGTLMPSIAKPELPINAKRPDWQKPNTNKFWFCVNETISSKKRILEQIAAEGEYSPEIIYRAVNSSHEVRPWLQENGLKRQRA